jgi:prolyl oligopeptidase
MRRFACLAFLFLGGLPAFAQWNYPATRTVDSADTYFGTVIQDPYRWLESLKEKDVKTWFKEQADLTDGILAKIPGRDALAQEWMALDRWQPANYSSISYENHRVFFRKTLGGENVGRLFFREGWNGADQLLFDPATYKPGATTTIDSVVSSFDGHYVALGLSSGGAEYSEIRILDVERRRFLPETIFPSLGPIGWTLDSGSIFYDAGKVTDLKSLDIRLNRKTRLHRLGTEVGDDRDFFSNESSPDLGITARERPVAYVSKYIPDYILGKVSTVQNEMRIFYAPITQLNTPKIEWKTLCKPSDKLVR